MFVTLGSHSTGSRLRNAKRPSNQAHATRAAPNPRSKNRSKREVRRRERKRLPSLCSASGGRLGSPRIGGAPRIQDTILDVLQSKVSPSDDRTGAWTTSQNSLALPARSGSAADYTAPDYTSQNAREKRDHSPAPGAEIPRTTLSFWVVISRKPEETFLKLCRF